MQKVRHKENKQFNKYAREQVVCVLKQQTKHNLQFFFKD
uniref:Uncharacterized protein n=1 Tax=Anguilla anguilla TaxID=7936 RepID=A0A0E9PTJ7_ANGAN